MRWGGDAQERESNISMSRTIRPVTESDSSLAISALLPSSRRKPPLGAALFAESSASSSAGPPNPRA